MSNAISPNHSLEDNLYLDIKNNIKSNDKPAINNKIIIHSIDNISPNRMNIALMVNDFVRMTHDEMISYYRVDYIPTVPDDIKA